MKLLLDTHAFLWFADQQQSAKLPAATHQLLEDGNHTLLLSLASVWEMAIKASTGKLDLAEPVGQLVRFQLRANDIELLSITIQQLDLIETLPPHHKDPFDRLLIAQAQTEQLSIVSVDSVLDDYDVKRIWLTYPACSFLLDVSSGD
jgi:PIN domain nuclease of toxin-antitoxin system